MASLRRRAWHSETTGFSLLAVFLLLPLLVWVFTVIVPHGPVEGAFILVVAALAAFAAFRGTWRSSRGRET